jgi:hypothetical protein
MKTNKGQAGFSLIELLIVVSDHRHHRRHRHPQPARFQARRQRRFGMSASMRTITSAEATYASTTGAGQYGDLPSLATEGLV